MIKPLGTSRMYIAMLYIVISISYVIEPQDVSAQAIPPGRRDSLSIPPFLGHKSIETFPVYATINESKWRIPRNYLESATLGRTDGYRDNYSVTVLLYMIITYPDFKGTTSETLRCFGPENCPQSISIATPQTRYTLDSDKNIKMFNSSRKTIYDLKIISMDGFQYIYAGHVSDDSQDIIFIRCNNPDDKQIIVHVCSVRFNVFGLHFWYAYRDDLLSKWKEIHNGVKGLLTSFHIGDDQ